MAAELKRLRRENEILRQQHEILKMAATFSPRREVDKVPFHRCGEEGVPCPAPMQNPRCQPKQLLRLAEPLGLSPSSYRPDAARACSRGLHAFPVAPNLLDLNFAATGSNQKWSADISYVWTQEGWLHLAIIIDLLARLSSAGPPATACTRNWPCRPCAEPSLCAGLPPASSIKRTAAANTAPWSTRS